MKRNIEDDPNNLDSGYNISLFNRINSSSEDKVLGTFQVLTDSAVADAVGAEYHLEQLESVMHNDEMSMYYELDLKDYVTVEYPVEEDENEIKVPNFVQNMLVEQEKLDGEALNNLDVSATDSIYDLDTINFDEIKCEFIRCENIDVILHVASKLQSIPNGIMGIRTAEMYKPYSISVLNAVDETQKFNNIISLTCYDEMKYSPYSFFRDLVSSIFEYTVSQKLFFQNDFSMFQSLDPNGLIRDLVALQKRENSENEDTRYVYFEIFLTLLKAIPNTLIFVEDLEKIDSSSYEVLKYIFETFDDLDISFLFTYDKDFSLHKDSHFLLNRPYYTEIALKPTSFEKLIEENKALYKEVLNNFYFQRVAKYACGSSLFIDIALQYLIESGVYEYKDDCIRMINPKTIIIPSNLDKLVSRRLYLLQDDEMAMKFLTSIVLLGTRVDKATVESLNYSNTAEIIEKLTDMGFMYEYNNCYYFPNYNLLRRNLLTTISKVYLKEVAKDLFDKVFNEDMPSPIKAYLYGLLDENEAEKAQWQELADISLSLGDFSAYLNSTTKILDLLDKNENPEQEEDIKNYKKLLYENISENLYDYVPEKTEKIAIETLSNIEKNGDVDKIIRLCNKMINGALIAGDYGKALELTHKVLSLLPPSSLNPQDGNFNTYFFLMSVIHIQILFNIGALKDCIDVGFKVLNFVNVLFNLISAFTSAALDYKLFAEFIYKAKIAAKSANLHQLELFCDLMIGYAYMQLGSYKKAEAIIYKIIKATNNKGMTTLLYVAWYVMSELHLKQNKYDVAFGIANNSLIQLEKNSITSEYLLMLFKYNMFKIMMFKKQYDKAEICINHAQYIAQKYGINFVFDTEQSHYVAVEEEELSLDNAGIFENIQGNQDETISGSEE